MSFKRSLSDEVSRRAGVLAYLNGVPREYVEVEPWPQMRKSNFRRWVSSKAQWRDALADLGFEVAPDPHGANGLRRVGLPMAA